METGIRCDPCHWPQCQRYFEMLYERQIPMAAKSFAVGMRVEHPQNMINESQYGIPDHKVLGPASYKVTWKADDGRECTPSVCVRAAELLRLHRRTAVL